MMLAGQQPFTGNGSAHPSAMYTPQYMAQGYVQAHDNSPISQGWTPTHVGAELPTLITPRRESISSAENDTPGTPLYPPYHAMTHGGVTILNRSPSGTYTTSTPSPLQMLAHYGMMAKVPEVETISPRLKMLVTKDPLIPRAIPAPSSPLKPLDRALENPRGETNVYIRGLMPETSDEMLDTWGRRFGDIKSSKSIIDHSTGLCKGFGFVRYHNYKDAEDCIRGFHHLGYEVSFARESFYSKLKAIADDGNTNLYVSNLPKTMNEHELANIFAPRKVCSARILRNSNGTGRGVGFARFESRNDCEEVIRTFNNKTITPNGEDHTIQIRYADTQEQKHLKQTTAAARQFRSAEYEFATQAHRSWLNGSALPSPTDGQENGTRSLNEFEAYLGHQAGYTGRGQNSSDPGWRTVGHRSPLSVISPNHNKVARVPASASSAPPLKGSGSDTNEGGVALSGDSNGTSVGGTDGSPSRVRSSKDV